MNELTHYKSSAVILLIAVGQKCEAGRRTCRIMWICFAGNDSGFGLVNSRDLANFFSLVTWTRATISASVVITETYCPTWRRTLASNVGSWRRVRVCNACHSRDVGLVHDDVEFANGKLSSLGRGEMFHC